MTISSRPISGEADKLQILALSRQFPSYNLRVVDLPYRLSSWALDEPENTRLWFDADGRLLAWAVLQTPFWFIDYAFRPEAASLHPQILDWADKRASQSQATAFGHPCWFVTVFSDQTERMRELEAAGFSNQAEVGEDSWSKVFLQRPGDFPVKEYRIPPGFVVRSLAGKEEIAAYVELHQTVFESKNMRLEWRQRTLEHPDYVPNLDVVVASPDGKLAAFCICWLQQVEGRLVGQVEPLGCHPDFRKYALGRVALAEGLRRLQAHGAQIIHVETDSYRNTAFRLYESMGFSVAKNVFVYRKDYAE
ncbi:MAG: GNAT family N-acetyltransferase [Chloroflexi bacterium HGW-Chloroflexi-6]|nr:MAG: GNAT family N-acetyltransferase [Chloroflexi bacterium HGW-Chloroflexi-6]